MLAAFADQMFWIVLTITGVLFGLLQLLDLERRHQPQHHEIGFIRKYVFSLDRNIVSPRRSSPSGHRPV